MEPQFRQLVVAVVPIPRSLPPQPYPTDDLQRLFADVLKEVQYQQFQFLPGQAGAQMSNSPDDAFVVQTTVLQFRRPIGSTVQHAREEAMGVLRAAARRLNLQHFGQIGLKVVAHVPAPGASPDAKMFVAEKLLHEGSSAVSELGPTFFAGGVKYRSMQPSGQGSREEVLLFEPLVADNSYVFVDYDLQVREQLDDLERVANFADEAFDFVRGPAMRILEA